MSGGVEAAKAIDGIRNIFNQEDTEAMILVDAANAFNNLNRNASLLNMDAICPEFTKYYYKIQLYVNGMDDGRYILSEEGSTQGDNAAMNLYACSIKPLMCHLSRDDIYTSINVPKAKQVWYADDSSAAGKIESLFVWWKALEEAGPLLGYHPEPTKCHIIVKNSECFQKAAALFSGTGVKITMNGRPFLGSFIGTPSYLKNSMELKVKEWVKDIEQISEIAVAEPHAAYYGYMNSLSRRWQFLLRTTKNSSETLQPLEDAIKDVFIPALVGRKITQHERTIFAPPTRFGGMGIANPCDEADSEYNISTKTCYQTTVR